MVQCDISYCIRSSAIFRLFYSNVPNAISWLWILHAFSTNFGYALGLMEFVHFVGTGCVYPPLWPIYIMHCAASICNTLGFFAWESLETWSLGHVLAMKVFVCIPYWIFPIPVVHGDHTDFAKLGVGTTLMHPKAAKGLNGMGNQDSEVQNVRIYYPTSKVTERTNLDYMLRPTYPFFRPCQWLTDLMTSATSTAMHEVWDLYDDPLRVLFNLLGTHLNCYSQIDAPMNHDVRFIILYSHGQHGCPEMNTCLLENLVVRCKCIIIAPLHSNNFDKLQLSVSIKKRTNEVTASMLHFVDQTKIESSPFYGVDTKWIFMIGYSFGGSTIMAQTRVISPDGIVCLDPWVAPLKFCKVLKDSKALFLCTEHWKNYDPEYDEDKFRSLRSKLTNAEVVKLIDFGHLSVTDFPLYVQNRIALWVCFTVMKCRRKKKLYVLGPNKNREIINRVVDFIEGVFEKGCEENPNGERPQQQGQQGYGF